MRNKHSDKYQYDAPKDLDELRQRVRDLVISIQSVEKQLGDTTLVAKKGESYAAWREGAKASLIFLSAEKRFLVDWGKAYNANTKREAKYLEARELLSRASREISAAEQLGDLTVLIADIDEYLAR